MTGPRSKVAFFVSTVTLRRILTINNLIRRRHILVNWCCTCCRDVESVDHSPIHCSTASRLRFLIVRLFGLGWVWVQLGTILEVLMSWRGVRVGRQQRKGWMIASQCLMWLIWLEHSRCTFQGCLGWRVGYFWFFIVGLQFRWIRMC